MAKNVQISAELWEKLCQFHLHGHELEEWEVDELWNSIELGIRMKQEAIARRESYTQYKSGTTADDREAARQRYLDQRGVPESFRWSQRYEEERKK